MPFDNVVRIVVPMAAGASSGSGFVVSVNSILPNNAGVYFVTNGHVVDGAECSTVKIHTTFEPRALDARVVSVCYDADLALLELCPAAREYCKQMYGPSVFEPVTFVKSPPVPGTKVICVGHPLGIERQTQAKGQIVTYMRTTDPNTTPVTIPLTDTLCNPGCSGGPAFTTNVNECVGMNSFKLRSDTIDGMSGIRPSHVIELLLPALLEPIRSQELDQKQRMTALKSMLGRAAGNVIQFLPKHVTDVNTAASHFKTHAIGGHSDGRTPRTLRSFLRKHVVDVEAGSHGTIRPGGLAVLTKALGKDPKETHKWRAGRTWTQVRNDEAGQPLVSALPSIPQPPALTPMPVFGAESHGVHDVSLADYYLRNASVRPGESNLPEGGAVVTSLLGNSIYSKAGGREGEIICAVEAGSTKFAVGVDGKVLCSSTDTRLTIPDVVYRQSLGSTLTFHVLTPDGDFLTRECEVAVPSFSEIPHVHMVHQSATNQMVRDQKENMNIGGIILTTLRLNHAIEMNMSEFEDIRNRYSFHAIVAHVSPNSPCYGHQGIGMGSVVTHVNEEEVTKISWDAFCGQLEQAISTGHIRLKTKLKGKTGIFAATTA